LTRFSGGTDDEFSYDARDKFSGEARDQLRWLWFTGGRNRGKGKEWQRHLREEQFLFFFLDFFIRKRTRVVLSTVHPRDWGV
jgi:hypothetical protein